MKIPREVYENAAAYANFAQAFKLQAWDLGFKVVKHGDERKLDELAMWAWDYKGEEAKKKERERILNWIEENQFNVDDGVMDIVDAYRLKSFIVDKHFESDGNVV